MNEKLLDILGGHLETGEENGTRYIDYLAEYEKVSSQSIEFGKNELDISQFITSEDVKTRIVPLGKKNEQTGEYLTIKSVNNGLDYVQDNSAISLFGVKEDQVVFDDVTQPENLKRKGEQVLQDRINKTISIEVSAADLHNLDVNIEAFRIGEYVRVLSKPHSLDRYFLLSKLSLALDNSSNCKMTLGATFKTLTQKQTEAEKQLNINVVSAVNNATEAKQQASNTSEEVVALAERIDSGYVTNLAFQNYQNTVNATYAKKQALETLEQTINDDFAKKEELNDYYTKSEIDTMIGQLDQRIKALEGGNT